MSFGLYGCGSTQRQEADKSAVKVQQIENANLVIPVNDVTGTAKFYSVTVDDTYMEVFAIREQ